MFESVINIHFIFYIHSLLRNNVRVKGDYLNIWILDQRKPPLASLVVEGSIRSLSGIR